MDSSELYRSMCEKAAGLQLIACGKIRRYHHVVLHEKKSDEVISLDPYEDFIIKYYSSPADYTIIFSQEQLQDLLETNFPPIDIIERITFNWKWERGYWLIFETYEQIWLAFVMKERFKLMWNSLKGEWEPLRE